MTIPLACQEQLLPGSDLIRKHALAAALGFAGIELRGRGELSLARRLPELRRARAAGVVMPTVCVEMDHSSATSTPSAPPTPSATCAPSCRSSPSWAAAG
ncbi:hypothetical protein [Micromonospora sp. ATCC 39149]|uniref:hypothetical protein n=1 Tax=Micromonospora sp. (strain ATCC 39149 / NRRL 15099 / SCC 1413) TaxID=219305 RepID=UPI0003111E1C|nr:hypothetical protein [Micromonospora sp. ATCC 39149]